jgi:hypothetical protein
MIDFRSLHRKHRIILDRVSVFAGYWFIVIGSILTIYAIYDILSHRNNQSASDGLQGLSICLPGVIIGFIFVWFRPFKPK